MNIKCPKCCGFFLTDWKFCKTHEAEYTAWSNDEYFPENKCENGHSDWEHGTIQMTVPPSYPEMDVYRCSVCGVAKIEHSRDGRVRICRYNEKS